MSAREVWIISAQRTAIGSFGGSLKDVPLSVLATRAVRGAMDKIGLGPAEVGHLVMGNVVPTEPRDAYLGRVAAVTAGIPKEAPAFGVNRLCGSGLQAIVSAAQTILLGDADIAIGAGAESMSRAPYSVPSARWGSRMGDASMLIGCLGPCTIHSSRSTWESPRRMWRRATAFRARCRMSLRSRVSDERRTPSPRIDSVVRSCRLRSTRAKGLSRSQRTRTYGGM